VRALAALSRGLAVVEGIGIAACLVALVGLAVVGFVLRNLRLQGFAWVPPPPEWADGALRHSVFVLGFLGAAYATFAARHIRIDAVTRLLAPRARLGARIVSSLACAALAVVLARAGYDFLLVCREEAGEVATQGQIFTSARGALVIIAGFGLLGFHFVVQAVIDAVYLASGREPPAGWIAEAGHGPEPAAGGAAAPAVPPARDPADRGEPPAGGPSPRGP
jgi:TRAP-type C4-dicarboxylate transport system permease small subunit